MLTQNTCFTENTEQKMKIVKKQFSINKHKHINTNTHTKHRQYIPSKCFILLLTFSTDEISSIICWEVNEELFINDFQHTHGVDTQTFEMHDILAD